MTAAVYHDPALIEKVRQYRLMRRPVLEIATELGLKPGRVRYLSHQFGLERRSSKVDIGNSLLAPYQVEAAHRGIALEVFIRKVLRTVVEDNLFTAILDDDGK